MGFHSNKLDIIVRMLPLIVPDLLAPDLRLVFCGSAPSRASAKAVAYYANPGNRFWATLSEVKLTPRLFRPQEYSELLTLGIGLTDLCKHHSGNDDELPIEAWDRNRLMDKIQTFKPQLLAFTSKTAARMALGRSVAYGLQAEGIAQTAVYVCCSTSGRARRFWTPSVWIELARFVRESSFRYCHGTVGSA